MFLSPDQIKTSLSSSEQSSSKGFDHLTLHRPSALPVRLFVSLHFRVSLVVKWSEGEEALIKASASLIICLMRICCCSRLPGLSSLPSVSCFFTLICSLTAFRINARMCDICLLNWSEIWNSSCFFCNDPPLTSAGREGGISAKRISKRFPSRSWADEITSKLLHFLKCGMRNPA